MNKYTLAGIELYIVSVIPQDVFFKSSIIDRVMLTLGKKLADRDVTAAGKSN